VGPRAGPDDVEKRKFLTIPGLKLRPLGRPARSQSLYRHEIRPKIFEANSQYQITCEFIQLFKWRNVLMNSDRLRPLVYALISYCLCSECMAVISCPFAYVSRH
jgi:hypothetical protein